MKLKKALKLLGWRVEACDCNMIKLVTQLRYGDFVSITIPHNKVTLKRVEKRRDVLLDRLQSTVHDDIAAEVGQEYGLCCSLLNSLRRYCANIE